METQTLFCYIYSRPDRVLIGFHKPSIKFELTINLALKKLNLFGAACRLRSASESSVSHGWCFGIAHLLWMGCVLGLYGNKDPVKIFNSSLFPSLIHLCVFYLRKKKKLNLSFFLFFLKFNFVVNREGVW